MKPIRITAPIRNVIIFFACNNRCVAKIGCAKSKSADYCGAQCRIVLSGFHASQLGDTEDQRVATCPNREGEETERHQQS